MSSNPSAGICPLVSRISNGEALAKAISLFVGRGKRYSYKDVERGAGVCQRMIECYKHSPDHEDWRPIKPEELASLCSFFGPEFTTIWLAKVAHQAAHWLPEGDSGETASLNTDCAEFNYEYSKATDKDSPGGAEIVPIEKHKLQSIGSRMVPKALAVGAAA